MDTEDFDYALPEELIAQEPAARRDESRLLVVDRTNKTWEDRIFRDIIDYLRPGDVLVRNNTRVIPARLLGIKEETGAHVELLLLRRLGKDRWRCLAGNAHAVKEGTAISFGNGLLKATCVSVLEEGIRDVRFAYEGSFEEVLREVGITPLPPYIKKRGSDPDRYQTVYAKVPGSAAAPTAGFHFSRDLLKRIAEKGVEIVDVTLHVGLGTFIPVREKHIEEHHLHSEFFQVSEEAAARLNLARKEGRRIIAVGTTVTRTLEAVMHKYGKFVPAHEETDLYITPGFHFEAIDALITNFHLPKSTLIMLVSAFLGREFTLECYRHAVAARYRFYSFGDAMFIYGKRKPE